MLETTGQHLLHAGVIVRPLYSLNLKLPVVIALGLPSLIDHHRDFYLKIVKGETSREILSSFIKQFYAGTPYIPLGNIPLTRRLALVDVVIQARSFLPDILRKLPVAAAEVLSIY